MRHCNDDVELFMLHHCFSFTLEFKVVANQTHLSYPILTITEVPHLHSRSTPSIKGAVSPWCCQRCRHDSQQIWGGTTNRVGVVKDCQNVCLALRIQILTLKAQCVCSRFGPTKNGKVHFHESYCKTLGFIYISLFFDLRSGNRKWSNYRKWPLIFNSLSTRCWGWPTSHAFGRGPGKANAEILSIISPCSSTYTSNISAEISGEGPMCCALRWRRSLHEQRGVVSWRELSMFCFYTIVGCRMCFSVSVVVLVYGLCGFLF